MESRPFKDMLDDLADRWGVPRAIMHRTALRAVGPKIYKDGRGRYTTRKVSSSDAAMLNISTETVVVRSATGAAWMCAIQPSTYKDKDGKDRPAAVAYSRQYLQDIALSEIPFSDFVPDPDSVDGRDLPPRKKRALRKPSAAKATRRRVMLEEP